MATHCLKALTTKSGLGFQNEVFVTNRHRGKHESVTIFVDDMRNGRVRGVIRAPANAINKPGISNITCGNLYNNSRLPSGVIPSVRSSILLLLSN